MITDRVGLMSECDRFLARGCLAAALAVGAMTMAGGTAGGQSKPEFRPGVFCLVGVREVGSCIQLTHEGQFRYFLSYGAYDERSEGTWRADGEEILLDTPAFDRKPQFRFVAHKPAEGNAHTIVVENQSGEGIAGIDVRVSCGSTISEGYTQYYGFETSCREAPQQIELGFIALGIDYRPVAFPSRQSADSAYHFAFAPGDLGWKSFAGVRLKRDGDGALVLIYQDSPAIDLVGQEFRYLRRQP